MKNILTVCMIAALLGCVLSGRIKSCEPEPECGVCVLQPSSANLLVNGDFEKNKCCLDQCFWCKKNFTKKDVPGWCPSPNIVIGRGKCFNKNLNKSWVAELDSKTGNCITQTVKNLTPGQYGVAFNWAAIKRVKC